MGQRRLTGLSALLDGEISHDKVTRFLSERRYTGKDLWLRVKPVIRQIEKAWTDESDLICWHFDHCNGRTVKGINLLNALYHRGDISIPVDFRLVQKPCQFSDIKTRRIKRASEVTKNELMREMVATCIVNRLKFKYVLMDSWFAAKENFDDILQKKKHFVAALKDNRLVALSAADKKQGRFVRVDSLELSDKQSVRGWLKGFEHEVFWCGGSLQTMTEALAG